jgi:hypothetical protein
LKVALALAMALGVSACKRHETGLVVIVTPDQGLMSTCMQLEISAGATRINSGPVRLAGKTSIVVGVAQGTFPEQVGLRALGFIDEGCQLRAREESALVSATFDKSTVRQVRLTLKKLARMTEVACGDGLDDDLDGEIDCSDSDCNDQPCTSSAACLIATRCSNGTCGGGQMKACLAPPTRCFEPIGVCSASDGECEYEVALTTPCTDSDSCTVMDQCHSDGSCRGTQRTCAQTANVCLEETGTCADGGCTFTAKPGLGCDDSDSCTIGDRCNTAGTCAGDRVGCVAPACRAVAKTCGADGGCLFEMADAGSNCDGGVCSIAGDCLGRFPYQPTNFDVLQARAPPAAPTVLDCGETIIDTSGTGLPRTTNWCRNQMFEASIIKQDGGLDAVLVSMSGLTIGPDAGLRLIGDKPVLFAVFGDAQVAGTVVTRSGSQLCGLGAGHDGSNSLGATTGGSGAGFSTRGGEGGNGLGGIMGPAGGGIEPNATASPLRGGCQGGRGGNQSGMAAQGGGGVQISASGTMTISGTIAAPGSGGRGGGPGAAGNGGGSGGVVVLEASELTISGGAITANGGGGGEGGGTIVDGQDGFDGFTESAAGAPGGTSGMGPGGAGGTGGFTSPPTAGTQGENGGGGGGSSGLLFFRGTAACAITPEVTRSPRPTLDSGCP